MSGAGFPQRNSGLKAVVHLKLEGGFSTAVERDVTATSAVRLFADAGNDAPLRSCPDKSEFF